MNVRSVVEMEPRDTTVLMRELERSLAYEYAVGVLRSYCASYENAEGQECFDLKTPWLTGDMQGELQVAARYLEWRGLLLRGAKDGEERFAIVLDEEEAFPTPEVTA